MTSNSLCAICRSPLTAKNFCSNCMKYTSEIGSSSGEFNFNHLVAAQNRTTAAVRSIAVFILINAITLELGGLMLWFGVDGNVLWLTFAGAAVIIIGFVTAVATSLAELKASDN